MASHDELKVKFLTMVVGKDAAHTPSRLSVRSSTPDATTCSKLQHYHNFHISNGGEFKKQIHTILFRCKTHLL